MSDQKDYEDLKKTTVSPSDMEEAHPHDEQITATEEPKEARSGSGERPGDENPAGRPSSS